VSRYISEVIKTRVREAARNRCGYCQSLQKYVLGILEIEHIIPTAAGGSDDEDNLWLSCRLCNGYKGMQTSVVDPVSDKTISLFNPRTQKWSQHFAWSEDGIYIFGLTACGRGTVVALQLNNVYALTVRQAWTSVGWHPPDGDD
jgi:HNH endonuclease